MKKIFTSIILFIMIVYFSSNACGIDVQIKAHHIDYILSHNSVKFPVILYLTNGPIYSHEAPIEYIGYIIIYGTDNIEYYPKGNARQAIKDINNRVLVYLDTKINTSSSHINNAHLRNWDNLNAFLREILSTHYIYFIHITTGQQAYDAYLPQYEKTDERADAPYALLNPLPDMRTAKYPEMSFEFFNIFNKVPERKEKIIPVWEETSCCPCTRRDISSVYTLFGVKN